jgi:murein DD-endopeptidase MepM/ murein hydrolase activator NlpD
MPKNLVDNEEPFTLRLERYGSTLRTETAKAKSRVAAGSRAFPPEAESLTQANTNSPNSSAGGKVNREHLTDRPRRFPRFTVRLVAVAGCVGALFGVQRLRPANQTATSVATQPAPASQKVTWEFPVDGLSWFEDSWGQPRMTGTKYAHTSQGLEIFGAVGTPVLAVVDGVIAKKGTSILGGNKLWLRGKNGSDFYYARIAFNKGVDNQSMVSAGEVIGFIGNVSPDLPTMTIPPVSSSSKSGDGTGPQVDSAVSSRGIGAIHFEYHQAGGSVKNPYSLLQEAYWRKRPAKLPSNRTIIGVIEQPPG